MATARDTRSFVVRVDAETLQFLDEAARRAGLSRESFVRAMIENQLGQRGAPYSCRIGKRRARKNVG